MRLVKMFGLAAIAAVAAMAFVGASSAMAKEATALCSKHEEPCQVANLVKLFHLVSSWEGVSGLKLLNSDDLPTILCLEVLGNVKVGALAAAGTRQLLETEELKFANCGTTSSHSNCTITVEALPKLHLLKTALNLGNVKSTGGLIKMRCVEFGFIVLECKYAPDETYEAPIEGAGHKAGSGNGMITLNNAPAIKVSGGGLCPENSTLDSLLEPLEALYITS